MRSALASVSARERRFWDEHVPSLEDCVRMYEAGPDANTKLMFDSLEPLAGADVLDFACGTGVTSVWLAERGARVTGIDVSSQSVARGSELARAVGVKVRFLVCDVGNVAARSFDRIVGRYALHHVDCAVIAPLLSSCLRPGGSAAFVETMDRNPLLRLARRYLVGHLGIPRYGTFDEHPLTRDDLRVLLEAFGALRTEVAEMSFLRIFDRQVLRFRSGRASRVLAGLDDLLLERLGWGSWSYRQVVVLGPLR